MTRETKVGIVVATSFLGLIGGVLAVKYLDPLVRKNSQVSQAQPDAGQPPPVDQVKPPPADTPTRPAAAPAMLPPMPPDSAPAGVVVPLTPAVAALPTPSPLVVPPAGALDIFAHFNETKGARGMIGSGLLTKAATLMLATEKVRQNQQGFDPNLRTAVGDPAPARSPVLVPMIHLPKPGDPPTGGITPPTPPPKPVDLPNPTGGISLPVPDAPKPAAGVTIKLDPPDPPKPDGPVKPDPIPVKTDPMPAAPVALPTLPMTTKPDPMPMGPVILPTVPSASKPDPAPVTPKPADVVLPTKPLDPPPVPLAPKPMAVKPVPLDVKPAPVAPIDIKPAPPPSSSPNPVDVKPTPAPITPFAGDPSAVPNLGSPAAPAADPKVEPAATFDPNRTRPAGPREDADSYDEEWHRCRDGETFAAISKAFYYTERYEQALRLYNVDRLGTENLRSDRPVLRADQTVRVPPARILERKYAASIPGLKSATPTGSPSAVGNPTPLATLGPVVADRSDGGSGPTEYEVTRPGMTLQAIAKEVLGSSDQWNRIFQLNRWVNSSEPVPVGAKIYVPRPTNR